MAKSKLKLPPTGLEINWKRIGYARQMRAKGRSIDPAVRRKLLMASPIWFASHHAQDWNRI